MFLFESNLGALMKSPSRFFARALAAACVTCLLIFATAASHNAPAQNTHKTTPVLGPTVDLSYMDRSVAPGDEFFLYANGSWIKNTEIPADRAEVDPGTPVSDQTDQRLADLVAEAAESTDPRSQKVAALYHSFMDEAGIEANGLAKLRPHLEAIAAIHDKRALARALGETLRADVDPLNNTNFHTANLFGLWVAPGFNDPEHYAAYLLQGGIALPDREYYLSDSPAMRETRSKYQQHVATMLRLAGFSDPETRAAHILELEHAISATHLSLADSNDIHKANNTWTKADFASKAPGLDWPEYFRGAGLSQVESFIVWQPSAFSGESALVASTDLATWKDWLAYHLIESQGTALPKAFTEERFAFFGKTLAGTLAQRPRWKRGLILVDIYLGDDLGQIYVQRYFPPSAKAQVESMVTNIKAAFRKRIDALTWMSFATKAEAKAKLDTLYVGVGYGESWHDYSHFEVKADDLFGNLWRGNLSRYHDQVARLGTQIDRKEWSMTPQTINAVNLPLQNALNFPAGILQPPYFDPNAPAAANYGSIGAVIGHEVSHTFDNEGSAFDSKGRVRNWWTPEDFAHFEAATAQLASQYDSYKPFPDLALNGKQTLGENIADLAGIAAAYDAYQTSLNGQAAPVRDGLTGDQQFFLAYAQSWSEKTRDAALRQQIATDGHSPGHYRALTVRNIDAWYAAFDIKPGQKLYLAPPDRVKIW